jgi:flagellar biosynthesis anti-sigma factor FlgM
MNIQGVIAKAYVQSYDTPPARNARTAASSDSTKVKKEAVQISDSSLSMQKVQEKVEEMPEVRIKVVEEIKERIKNNDYPIDQAINDAIEKMVNGRILETA